MDMRQTSIDGLAAHGAGEDLGLEAGALAGLAGQRAHVFAEAFAGELAVGFGEAALQIGDHALEGLLVLQLAAAPPQAEGDLVLAGTVQQHLAEGFGQLLEGRVHAHVVVGADAAQQLLVPHHQTPAAAPPGFHGAVVEAAVGFGHEQFLVEDLHHAEAVAGRARAVGTVKGEVAGGEGVEAQPARQAGVLFGIQLFVPLVLFFFDQHPQHPLALAQCGLDRIVQSRANFVGDDEAVDDEFDGVLAFLVELRRLLEFVQGAVHPGPDEPLLAQRLKHFLVFAFAAGDFRGEQHDLGAGRTGHDLVDDLFGALFGDRFAALRTMRFADVGEQEAEVVVDLGGGRDDRPGIRPRRALFNRDRR
jgi:hypothetical protein